MKNISAALKTHLAQEVTTMTTCMLMKLVWRQIPVGSVTKANPAVITSSYEHNLTTGQYIAFDDVEGMTEINETPHSTDWNMYTVTVISTTTFSIDVDSTSFTTHTADTGTIREIVSFTDSTSPINIDNILYTPYEGFTRSAATMNSDMSVDTIDLTGIVGTISGGVTITVADVLAGRFDMAEMRVFQVNYEDLTMGRMWLKRGWLGVVSVEDDIYTAELRGMTQLLQTQTIELYSATCRYDLGDSRCGFNLSGNMPDATPATVTGSVTGVTDNRIFFDTGRSETTDNIFKYGLLTWTTGENAGLSMEVKEYTFISSNISLVRAMPFTIVNGDDYVVYKGCNKIFQEHCIDKFSNGIRFGGYPFLPGEDELLKVIKAREAEVQ